MALKLIRRYKEQLRAVTGVSASGGTIRCQIPVGRRLLAIFASFYHTGGTNTALGIMALLNEIRFYIETKVQRRYPTQVINGATITGGQILYDDLLLNGVSLLGVPNTAPGVVLPIYFAEPYRKDRDVQNAFGLPTQWEGGRFSDEGVRLEIDFAGATAAAVKFFALFDDMIPTLQPGQARPGLTKVYPYPCNASGVKYAVNPPDREDLLTQLSIYPDGGAANDIEVATLRKNGNVLHDLSAAVNKTFLTDNGMTPVATGRTANIYDIVFDPDDMLIGAEDLREARSLSLEIDAGAGTMSGTQLIMVQRVGQPD